MSRFTCPFRVYYEDTDAGGVVYYANYLKFFERTRTEWLRLSGFPPATLAAEAGVVFVVAAVNVEYRRPARLDDEIVTSLALSSLGRSRLVVDQEIHRGDELLVRGTVTVACVDTQKFKPAAIPQPLRTRLESGVHGYQG